MENQDFLALFRKNIPFSSVEGFFAILQRGNYGVYHHWSRKYLGQYLREFDWHYNVRKLPDMERAVIALKLTGGKRLMLNALGGTKHN